MKTEIHNRILSLHDERQRAIMGMQICKESELPQYEAEFKRIDWEFDWLNFYLKRLNDEEGKI